MSERMMELTDVSKYFAKGSETIRAVDGVSFSVQRGDFVTIQGASGVENRPCCTCSAG